VRSPESTAIAILERLIQASNAHDLAGVVGCFADDYALDAPAHPKRSFRGSEQVRRNWTQIFADVPNIATSVLRTAVDGDTVWAEMEMRGTRRDGSALLHRGVFIFGTADGQIRTGRMFLEPVEERGGDMDAAVRNHLRPGDAE
jgi:ketosteroid isomerase-like protein